MEKILVLDNDEDVLEVLVEALHYSRFDARGLPQSTDIFELIREFEPRIVLIDLAFSGNLTPGLCHTIRNDPDNSNISLIITSAYTLRKNAFIHTSCDFFIEKPFDLALLLEKIKYAIKCGF